MQKFCFLNGKIVSLDEAKVGVEDIGIMRGFGIYDGITAFGGKPFHFADHWQRFLNGAHILNLNIPITEEKTEKVIKELIEKNNFEGRANIRMILTGGKTLNGIEYNFDEPTFFILTENWEPLPKNLYEDGGRLITYNHKRELPEYKTTNYIRATMLQNWRKEENAIEILFVSDGEVLECATSNIFIVKDKTLVTPEENILKGITRKVVLEIALDKYKVETRPIREDELKTADEVFITSSFKDIVPIVKIDDFEIASGKVGEVTKDIMTKFSEYVAKY